MSRRCCAIYAHDFAIAVGRKTASEVSAGTATRSITALDQEGPSSHLPCLERYVLPTMNALKEPDQQNLGNNRCETN